jgi:exosortase E/protease (VPEID-CTERM system)
LAHSIDPVADVFIPRHHPYVRPVALVLLILGEAFLLSMRFDSPSSFSQGPWWACLVYRSHLIIRLLLVIPIAIAAFSRFRLLVRIRRAFEIQSLTDDRWPFWLLAHGLALVGFTWLTLLICEGNLAASSLPGAWVLVGVGAGIAVVATWMATLLAPTTWLALLRRSRKEVLMGFSVAFGVYFLGQYTDLLWDSMAGVTLTIVRMILGLVTGKFADDPGLKIVSLDGFQVNIAAACSGLEGIGLILAFLSVYLWWFRNSMRWPHSLLLLPVGAVVIFLLNSVRIASLVMIGAWASPEVALGAFHSQAGWLAFLGVSLGLVAATRQSSVFAVEPSVLEPSVGLTPSAAFLFPFLAVLATSMLTGAFASSFDRLYGLRVLTGGLALWYFRNEFAGLLRDYWSWTGVATGVIAFGLWVALEPVSAGSGRALALAVGELPKGQAWAWIALRVIGSVAIVPLVEELAFRGFLTRRLSSVDFKSIPIGRLYWPTLLISSAAFGILHGRWLAGTLVGVLYGLALCRKGKLGDAIVAHAVTNGLIATTVLATGDWTMWT